MDWSLSLSAARSSKVQVDYHGSKRNLHRVAEFQNRRRVYKRHWFVSVRRDGAHGRVGHLIQNQCTLLATTTAIRFGFRGTPAVFTLSTRFFRTIARYPNRFCCRGDSVHAYCAHRPERSCRATQVQGTRMGPKIYSKLPRTEIHPFVSHMGTAKFG